MMIDGGIRMPSVPEPASDPIIRFTGYPRFVSSGSAIRDMVAAVAVEEPETPPNICSLRRDRKRISPIHMNMGSAVMVQSALLPQIVVATTLPTGGEVNA